MSRMALASSMDAAKPKIDGDIEDIEDIDSDGTKKNIARLSPVRGGGSWPCSLNLPNVAL
jgi:hypothetical protein